MTAIRVDNFGGLVPRLDEKRLPPNCAVEAINVDLNGRGIAPRYATTYKRTCKLPGPTVAAGAGNIIQVPMTAFKLSVVTNVAGKSGSVSIAAPNAYTIGANDHLWVAVYIPADDGYVAAGGTQGGVQLVTNIPPLAYPALTDQNGLNMLTGDITNYAVGKWYIRRASLATEVGRTLSEIQLYGNRAVSGLSNTYFGFIGISTSANIADLVYGFLDPEMEQLPTGADAEFAGWVPVDSDESAFISSSLSTNAAHANSYSVSLAPVPTDGAYKGRAILTADQARESRQQLVYGSEWYGLIEKAEWVLPSLVVKAAVVAANESFLSHYCSTSASSAYGGFPWRPEAAMTLGVVGGTGPTITRSYVYTLVSEAGVESPPSPAVTASGNRDGTWQLTGIAAWAGTTDMLEGHKKRIYRTPEGSSVYRFVAEIAGATTSANDTALDTALGEELTTSNHQNIKFTQVGGNDVPMMLTNVTSWNNGIIGAIIDRSTIAFCDAYAAQGWPLANRYQVNYQPVATGKVGDRFVALTTGKPWVFAGTDPADLVPSEIDNGEPCLRGAAALSTDVGVIYPGRTGWGLVDYNGYRNITEQFLAPADYAAAVTKDVVACFDNRRLLWIAQGGTTGYAFEFGAEERSLTKWESPHAIHALGYYGPRDIKWVAYKDTDIKQGKLWDDTGQPLKWTWKSKLLRLAKPVRFKVAQIDSNEWDSLSVEMKNREVFLRGRTTAWLTGTDYIVNDMVTQGGNTYRCLVAHTSGVFANDLAALKWVLNNAVYTIDITGLTQPEAWVYLKVWCEADKGTSKVLVYDDFVVSDRPVRLARAMKSDCWQFEIRGNMAISSIALAEMEKELNAE